MGKESACNEGDTGKSEFDTWDLEDPLEEGMATHSSILACGILWTEEHGGLPSMWSHGVGHD